MLQNGGIHDQDNRPAILKVRDFKKHKLSTPRIQVLIS